MKKIGLPPMCPNLLRHLFATATSHMVQAPWVGASPFATGAAMLMGHSLEQWQRTYDLMYDQRLVDRTVEAMPAWREAVVREWLRSTEAEDGPGLSDPSRVCPAPSPPIHSSLKFL